MIKKILILLFTALVISSIAFFSISAISEDDHGPSKAQLHYSIGDQVYDAGGNLWVYKGNFRITLGQLTKELKLLTVFVCNQEKMVIGIHKETIPFSSIGDVFTLVTPTEDFKQYIISKKGIDGFNRYDDCNVTIADPIEPQIPFSGGELCCLHLSCGDKNNN